MNSLLIDIGGSNIRIACTRHNSNEIRVLLKDRIELRAGKNKFLESLKDCISRSFELCSDFNIEDKMSVAIGVTGYINQYDGTVSFPPVFPDLEDVELVKELSAITTRELCLIENDANARCWGEYLYLANKDVSIKDDVVVVVNIGTGLGAGIVANNKLLRGKNNLAGEIGYMFLPKLNRMSNTDEIIAREFCSGTGLVRLANLLIGKDKLNKVLSNNNDEIVNAELICREILSGNKQAAEVWRSFEKILAMLLYNISCCLDPSTIVLSGGLTLSKIFDVKCLEELIRQKSSGLMEKKRTKLVSGKLGDDGVLVGLAALISTQDDSILLPRLTPL